MNYHHAIILFLGSIFFSGCASDYSTVSIDSLPSGAEVMIDGKSVGTTPTSLKLLRNNSYEVRIEKEGYNPAIDYLKPVANDKAENKIRFGLAEDFGHYVDLQPSSMKLQLRSELVPHSTGADPFKTMAEHTREADRQLEAGNITAEEHKYIIEQIIAFFEAQG
jgi:hypothetical protein